MLITSPNTIQLITSNGTTYGNGLQIDETQFVLNTSDEAGGEYGIGSNLSDQSVIMNAVQAGDAMQHEVTLGGVDEAYNGSVVFGIESNGKIKTNQAQTVAPTALVAYTERIPIYDTTGTIIAYLPFQ
jgi:gamma-glutamyltranspeptidase